jgi:hypothetical protein
MASATAATAPPWSVLYWFCNHRAGRRQLGERGETKIEWFCPTQRRGRLFKKQALTATAGEMVMVQETREEVTTAEETMARTSEE